MWTNNRKPCGDREDQVDMKGYVWVAYSKMPPYLPIAVADSAAGLARKLGITRDCILSTWSHFRHERLPTSRFHRVSVDNEL